MDREAKFESARLGIQAEELKAHPAMQALLERLQHRAEEAREQLTEHPAHDAVGVLRLQNEVALFKRMVSELDGMIVEGRLCEQELHEEGEGE